MFVDSGGSFNNDTECVDGPRGAAAAHLTKDVRPYVISTFGAAPDASKWGVIGWSMGGTCAMDLTVTHPELFTAFGDIGGDPGPNTGTKEQTVDRLFGGDATKWDQYDPQTVMSHHGAYAGVSGIFVDADGRKPDAAGHVKPTAAMMNWSPPGGWQQGPRGGGNGARLRPDPAPRAARRSCAPR